MLPPLWRARVDISRVHTIPNRDEIPPRRAPPRERSLTPILASLPRSSRHSSSIPPSALANAAFMDISYHWSAPCSTSEGPTILNPTPS